MRSDGLLLLKAAGVNAVLFAGVLCCLTLAYETNDDVGIASIASGLLTGKPAHDLVVSNVLAGYVLQALYQFTDRVNWYTVSLIAVHFAAMTGLLWLFLRTVRSRVALVLFVLLFAEFEVGLLLWLQYTSVAVVAGLVGLLLVTSGLRGAEQKSQLAVSYGAMLMVLSGLVRAPSLYYAAVLSLPFLSVEWIMRRAWRPIAQTSAIFALALLPIAFDHWHYRSDPAWDHFRKTHAIFESLIDAPMVDYSEATRYFFDRVGLSRTDWEMLKSQFCADPDLYSIPRLTTIVDRFHASNWGRVRAADYLRRSLGPLTAFQWMTSANLLLALLLSSGGRFKVLLVGLCECLLVAVLFVLLSNFSKLLPRIALPFLFAVNIVVFFAALEAAAIRRFIIPRPAWRGFWRLSAGVGAMAFCACYGWAFYRTAGRDLEVSDFNRHTQQAFQKTVHTVTGRYVARQPDVVFFNWGAVFPSVFCSPFDNLRDCRQIPTLPVDWSLNAPLLHDRLREFGFDNLYRGTYRKANVRLFMSQDRIQQLTDFVRENYHERIVAQSKDFFLIDDDYDSVAPHFVISIVRMVPASERLKSPENLRANP